MKRIDKTPTEDTLVDLLAQDSIGRNEDMVAFLANLDLAEGGYSIFIDGQWGDGKTFFVKQAIALLKNGNDNLEYSFNTNDAERLSSLLSETTTKKRFLPIYYNAWENDYSNEPVLSIIDQIVTEYAELSGQHTLTGDIDLKISGLVKSLSFNIGPVGLSGKEIAELLGSKDILSKVRIQRDTREKLSELLTLALHERADKLVLFIDELDRCSPSYAIKTLEAIKFLFDLENVTVVFSTDRDMLAHAIEGFYGTGFNGRKYLERFYDRIVTLSPVATSSYFESVGFSWKPNNFDKFVDDWIKQRQCAMRDINRYYEALAGPRAWASLSQGEHPLIHFVDVGLILTIALLRIENPAANRQIFSGKGSSLLWNEISISDGPLHILDVVWSTAKTQGVVAMKDPSYDRELFFSDIYNFIFNGIRSSSLSDLIEFSGDDLKKRIESGLRYSVERS